MRTRIVCTIGPATAHPDKLRNLVQAGLSMVRLNGAHNSLEWHRKTIALIRRVAPSTPVLLDLPGRKVRTVSEMTEFNFKIGDEVVFGSDIAAQQNVQLNYDGFYKDVEVGQIVLADDAQFAFKVEAIEFQNVRCKALSSGVLKSAKGINVPYVRLNTPKVTDRDKDLLKFAKEVGVDFVGVSFVESSEHVKEVKSHLKDSTIEIISKIENKFGLDKLDEIIECSFGILMDRGDLGAETSIYDLPILQKRIIHRANQFGKPVIIATEMLHHMINHPYPTKAELNDISNAVLDGCSAVMLSGESAVGQYPTEAVETMRKTITKAERFQDELEMCSLNDKPEPSTAIARAVAEICRQLPVTKIVCVSLTGYAAQLISRYNLTQPIFVVTDTIEKARKFNLYKGASGFALNIQFERHQTEHVLDSIRQLYLTGHLQEEDLVVIVAVRYPLNNYMNSVEIQRVGNLISNFQWKRSLSVEPNL